MDRPRETWVPPEERREEWMMENTGEDSAHSFVYFPKVEVNGFHCIEIPAGAKVYRGIRKPCGVLVDPASCEDTPKTFTEEEPIRPDAAFILRRAKWTQCRTPAWYSDRTTARRYASGMSDPDKYVYTFQTTRPLTLINLMDVRNVERLLRFAQAFVLDALKHEEWKERLQEDVLFLITATGYPPSKIASMFPKLWSTLSATDKDIIIKKVVPRVAEPSDSPELDAEFGDQSILNRVSNTPPAIPNDIRLVSALQDLLPAMPIHGYYAPISANILSKVPNPYFHRELCLFQSAGLVKHLKEDPLDGCVAQQKKGGSSGSRRWPTRKHGHERGRRLRGSHYTRKASTAGQKREH